MADGIEWERRLHRAGAIAWAAVGVGLALWLGWRTAAPVLAKIAPSLVAAVIVAAVIEPAAGRLERFGIRRGVTAATLGGLILGGLTLGVAFLAPRSASVATAVADVLPGLVEELQDDLGALSERYPALAMIDLGSALDAARFSFVQVAGAAGTVAYFAGSIVAGIVAGIYLANDLPHLLGRLGPVEGRRRSAFSAAQRTFARYLRGQLILSLFVGIATAAAAWAIGVPRPVLIGAVAGVTNLIPLLGPIVGGAVGGLVALVVGQGAGQALLFVLAVIVIQQVESAVLAPRIQGEGLKVRPTLIILTLALAGAIGGVPLMAVALPATISVREAAKAARQRDGAKDATVRSGTDEDEVRGD